MASKSKKRSKAGSFNPIDQLRRQLERGDFRQALKDARVAYRQNPSQECRCYLEHAYIGRAQQLLQNGLTDDGRRIARELLDLGPTEPSVQAAMPSLLLSLGLFDSLAQGTNHLTEEERRQIRVKAADQAVIKPENTPKSMADLLDDAKRIRAALEAIERADDAAAIALLKDIARQSLLADWKYFVRGLIAYYRQDKNEMLANWDRLDPDRTAARIAAPLKVLAGAAQAGDDGVLRAKVARLERQATSRTIVSELGRLRQTVVEKDWPQMLKSLRAVRGQLRSLDLRLYQRLVSCLCGTLVQDGLVHQVHRLSQVVDPLPLDPHWNRAKAIASEFGDFDDDPDAEEYWRRYLADLDHVSALSPAQRDLARAFVWLHLAASPVVRSLSLRHCRCGFDHSQEIEEAENQAREAFERSLTLAPDHEAAYLQMARFHRGAGRAEEAAGVYRRMLRHLPDNLDALLALGNYYVARGEFRKARELADRARQLKPLDAEIRNLARTVHVGMARTLSLESQFDRAREELAAADRLNPAEAAGFEMLARKAVLEIKAGAFQAARRLVEQAQQTLSEPGPLWLAMAIEAYRHDLPKEEAWLYEKRWHDALRRRCRSETAGRMCGLLSAHLGMSEPYPQSAEHTKRVVEYVRRCKRVKWQAADLRTVCEFLERARSMTLLADFARQGWKKFPEVAYFQFVLGTLEFGKGPARCDRQAALGYFQKAIELAAASGDPVDKAIMECSKEAITLFENAVEDDDDEDDYEDDYDEEDEDDYDDEDDEDDGGYDDEYGYADDLKRRIGEQVRAAFPSQGDVEGLSLEDMVEILRRACAQAGLDPEVVIDELKTGKPRRGRARK